MLRKRQPQPQPQQPLTSRSDTGSKGKGKVDAATLGSMRDPKALEDLVQQVMRDLPRVQGLRGGEERAVEVEEALKKLDKGFDGGSSQG